MSIARAFTRRYKRKLSSPTSPSGDGEHREDVSPTTPRCGTVMDRRIISKPIELISTTNMLSYNAPDVAVARKMRQVSSISSSASSSSEHDSDGSTPTRSSAELTEASSVENSPLPKTLKQNHLSSFFEAAQNDELQKRTPLPRNKQVRRSISASSLSYKLASMIDGNAPAIPQRAASHSKSAHVRLARKRSLQSISSERSAADDNAPASTVQHRLDSFRSPRSSADIFRSHIEPDHPFGPELEKLSEVAEDLDGTFRDAEVQDDINAMVEGGLVKWTANDYAPELAPLNLSRFSKVLSLVHHEPPLKWI